MGWRMAQITTGYSRQGSMGSNRRPFKFPVTINQLSLQIITDEGQTYARLERRGNAIQRLSLEGLRPLILVF